MTTAQAWIETYAHQLGVDPLDADTIETLLQLAGIAAHTSERLAAPLACYLVGVAGITPELALEVAQTTAAQAGAEAIPS